MTDIVQRLRDTIINETPARYPDVVEAAITEIEQLRTLLKLAADAYNSGSQDDCCIACMDIDAVLSTETTP